MKRVILQATAILLMLAGVVGCEKEEEQNISLEYKKCECDHETVQSYSQREFLNILMIDISKTTEDKINELNASGQHYVYYDPAMGGASFCLNPGQWVTVGFICNFPTQFNWEIPVDGIRISFTCDAFEKCDPIISILEHSYLDIVLTSLKIQAK
jgi:hypothetical protein